MFSSLNKKLGVDVNSQTVDNIASVPQGHGIDLVCRGLPIAQWRQRQQEHKWDRAEAFGSAGAYKPTPWPTLSRLRGWAQEGGRPCGSSPSLSYLEEYLCVGE